MKAEYPFNLYMMAPPRREPIDVTQNDNLMVELVAKLKNRNGTAFLPPEGAVANFIAVKPDGTGIVLRSDDPEDPKVTLADDEVRVSLPREALAVTGWIACKIAIQDNEAIASAQEFSLICNRDLLPEDFTESEAYQSIIYYLQHLGEREAEFDDMRAQFIEAISGITEDSEVINARVDGPYSTTYDTLKLRLDAMSALLKGIVDGDFENRVSDLEDEVEDARGEFDALVDRLDDTDGRIADNAGEIDSAKVKILQLEQENKQLKKIVEDSNPTQSPRVSSGGYGVVSLPKNAGQGPMDVKMEGLTLKNELDYNPETWEEWVLADNASISNGLVLAGTGTANTSLLNINAKSNTKYGLLLNVLENSINGAFRMDDSLTGTTESLFIGGFTGPYKKIILTQDVIVNNYIGFNLSSQATEGEIEISDIRLFELPPGSEIESDFETLSADELARKYPYVQGGEPRNTSGTFRVRSVGNYEPYKYSEQYVNGPELRSLPNGVADSIDDGKLIKRASDWMVLTGNDIDSHLSAGSRESVYVGYTNPIVTDGVSHEPNSIRALSKDGGYIATQNTNNELRSITLSSNRLYVNIEKSKVDGMSGETLLEKLKNYLNLYPISLCYQLATPEIQPVQTSGSVHSYPSGTVYVEPAIADVGVYSGGVSILNTDYPIHQLESISKIDFDTGLPTEIDTSTAVIAPDGLTFTHSALSNGDIVFFTYLYDDIYYTEGKLTCEYYDSRYVLKDDVTGKFYKEVKKVENGELVTQLVEV